MRGLSTVNLVLALLVAAGAGAGGSWWWAHRPAPTGDAMDAAAPGASAPASAASGPARRFAGGRNAAQPVTVAAARQQDVRVMLQAIGNMAAFNTAVVRARVEGELRAIRFQEGQMVRAGQVLAEIDARTYEAALAQAQGQLARDQAQLRNAQLDLERYKDLLAKDSIAKQQVDTQEALVKQLQGTVQADQATVENAKLLLSYTQVTAPIAGRLGLKQVDLGSIVRSSDANGLVSITQTHPIALVFAVPEANLRTIARKLRAREVLAVEAWDRDQRVKLGEGKVITIDNAIDATTGTIKVKAEFANADGALFPNQFVNVRLQVDTLPQQLVVPQTAVQRGAVGTFVYAVKDDGVVALRRVRTGAAEGDWIAVQGELTAGEKVVTDGADRLREGAKVEVVTPPPMRGGAGMGGGGSAGAGRPGGMAAGNGATSPPAGANSDQKPAYRQDGSTSSATKTEAKAGNTAAQAAGAAGADASGRPAGGAAPGPARGPAAGGAPGAAPSGAAAPAPAGDLPPWLDRLPPEVQERFKAMNAAERQAFIEKLRERRRQMREQGGGE